MEPPSTRLALLEATEHAIHKINEANEAALDLRKKIADFESETPVGRTSKANAGILRRATNVSAAIRNAAHFALKESEAQPMP